MWWIDVNIQCEFGYAQKVKLTGMHCSAHTVLLLSLKNRSISAGCSQSKADVVLIRGRYQMTFTL